MNRTNHLLLPLALAIFGISITAGYPDWGTLTGLVTVLLAAGVLVGELSSLREKNVFVDKRGAQKISNGLVTLSSAAILAVYLAGYHRTSSAAARYAQQDARIKASEVSVPASPPTASGSSVAQAREAQTAPPIPAPVVARPRKGFRKTSSNASANPPSLSPSSSRDSSDTGFAPVAIRPPDDQPKKPVPAVITPAGKYKDGTYSGWGTSRHGDIQASVVIQDGQIVSAEIAKCLTRYPCSWIIHLPDQVVVRQSTEINFVSGATESSDAFFEAVAQALSQALE